MQGGIFRDPKGWVFHVLVAVVKQHDAICLGGREPAEGMHAVYSQNPTG